MPVNTRTEAHVESLVVSLDERVKAQEKFTYELDRKVESGFQSVFLKLDSIAAKGQMSPSTMLGIVALAMAIGGTAVQFVRMSLSPIEKIQDAHTQWQILHERLDMHPGALMRVTSLESNQADDMREIALLRQRFHDLEIEFAKHFGADEQRWLSTTDKITALRTDIDRAEGDKFYGREGQELRQRIIALEQFLMKKSTIEK